MQFLFKAFLGTLIEGVLKAFWQWRERETLKKSVRFEERLIASEERHAQLKKDLANLRKPLNIDDAWRLLQHRSATGDSE